MIEDGMYRFLHRDTVKGGVKSVNIPNGHAFHSHPRLCKSLKKCSLQPPSADDMKVFVNDNSTQFVLTKKYLYSVRLIYDPIDIDPDDIYTFFREFELYFDRIKKGTHLIYENLWEKACIWCNLFVVYKFTKCKKGIYKIHEEDYTINADNHLFTQ